MAKERSLPTDKKIFSVDELKEAGFSHYKINQMVDEGRMIKLTKKYYENTNYTGEESDFFYVPAYAPKGIVCLMSAASYYNLTTYRTDAVDVAIPRKSKISTMPDWPQFDVFYFPNDRFETGVATVHDGKNEFRIYDMEKTVVDIVFYRERVGIEETKEILVNYLRRKDRNLNRLIRYAELLKCSDVMKTYLEVLV
ncbi:MAG: type IV toxin-antitoxin system AbiEi family antitoxin domain-containing protein [Lachnospiraceae bacterium]|nr:type IV toxin-antitoxin system AbiEi family antitoxin domain-containing protein [Lachnospiraceae bacterium]